jgi:hemoglobin
MRKLSILGMLAALTAGRPAAAQQPADTSLYARLGGVYAIASVVDEFIDRLLVDSVLNANPRIKEARDRVPAPGLKYHVTELVCQVTGGPCKYTGRAMKQAHAHLAINEAQWREMVTVFRAVLDQFKVPAREQGELVAIVESTKPDIVLARP